MKRIPIDKTNKLKYSLATYEQPEGSMIVDLKELAEKISKFQFPEKLNFTKSSEIVLLAREYLEYRQEEDKRLTKKGKK